VIGRAAAVANIFGIHVPGCSPGSCGLFIHLIYIVSFRARQRLHTVGEFEYFRSAAAAPDHAKLATDFGRPAGSMGSKSNGKLGWKQRNFKPRRAT